MKRQASSEDESADYIGDIPPQAEMKQVDFELQTKAISDIQLTILDHKEQAGDIQWYIKVDENARTNPQKAITYNIKRKFSEIKWLIQILRELGNTFILPIVGIGSDSITTYIKTKVVKDTKTFEFRHQHLNRFLQKLCSHKEIVNQQVFQIFISKQKEDFDIFRKKYQEQHKAQAPGVLSWFKAKLAPLSNMIPRFTSDSQTIIAYKQMLVPIERDVNVCYEAISDIFTSHSQYLNYLREYDAGLVAADEEYGKSIEKLVKWLQLILEEIEENKREVGRERSKQEHDRFKTGFQDEVKKYKKEVDEQLKALAKELSRANEVSCVKVSQLFREKFTIQI